MDSDERVTALKKAYAEIILNTAKEAAARVMVSERKAQRFEHEVKVVKEEGLRMLLRIKQMMDAKVSEAELTALSQKKNIDELEAQLHEAEDIVRDLREELREVQSELERLKSYKTQCLEKSDIPTHRQLNKLYLSQQPEFRPQELFNGSIFSHRIGHTLNDHGNAANNCYRTSFYRGYSNGGSPDLPSIISRRKEPLFYRNGCTQRILACDKDRLDQEFAFSTRLNNMKDEMSIKEVEGGKVTCNVQRQEKENRKTSKTDQALACLSPDSSSDYAHSIDDRSETSPRVLSTKGGLSIHSDCSGNLESGEKLVNSSTDQGRENRHARLTWELAQQNMKCGKISDKMDPDEGNPSPIELDPKESESSDYLPKPTNTDKHFKYTFQRKRKRDSLVNENEYLENNLPEEHVPDGSNNILNENCDLKNSTFQGYGKPKESTSDIITDPENNTFSRYVVEEQNTSINSPKSS